MKPIITSLLVLAVTTFVADGREVGSLSFRGLDKKTDIIVVAKPISTKDTAEQIDLPNISPSTPVIGMSSEFEVSIVLKGDKSLKKLVVHHYRLKNPDKLMGNAPNLAFFDRKESTRYLLFLQREPDGRYAPFDQVDPASSAMLKLNGPKWDKMKLEDFKKWLDAMKWLDEESRAGAPRPWSNLSPEIPPGDHGVLGGTQ